MRGDLTKFKIQINHTILERIGNDCDEKSTRFLRMHIDCNLTWKYHVNEVKNNVARALFSNKHVQNVLPTECLRTLYFAIINSHFTYGITAWGNADKRVYNSHTDLQFKALEIFKITGNI